MREAIAGIMAIMKITNITNNNPCATRCPFGVSRFGAHDFDLQFKSEAKPQPTELN